MTIMLSRFFRKGHSNAQDDRKSNLKRYLNLYDLIAQGVGMIVGGGIFVTIGIIASDHTGPAISMAYLLSGLIILLLAFCYINLHERVPSGGVYAYAYALLGEGPAWLVLCIFALSNLLGACFVAIGFSEYVSSLLSFYSINIPIGLFDAFATANQIGGKTAMSIIDLPATAMISIVYMILSQSIKTASAINNFLVIIKFLVVLSLVIFGVPYLNVDHYMPYLPSNTGACGEFGVSGLLLAIVLEVVLH